MWGCSLSGPACGIMWKFYSLDILFHQHERLCIWWPGFQARHCAMPFGCSTHSLTCSTSSTATLSSHFLTTSSFFILLNCLRLNQSAFPVLPICTSFPGCKCWQFVMYFFHMVTQLHQNLWSLLDWSVDFVYHPSHWLIGKVALNLEAEVQSCVMLRIMILYLSLEHS